MFGGGSIQGMRNSLSNNKKLLRSKKYFQKERSFLNVKAEYLKAAEGKHKGQHISKEELLIIKQEIRTKISKERRREALILVASLLVMLGLVAFFVVQLIRQDQLVVTHQEELMQQEKESAYLHLVEKGDDWLKQSKWYNSRFNYKKNQKIYPHAYAIHYRILNSYVLECETDVNHCYQAKQLMDEMLLKFPDKKAELNRLKQKLIYEY